MKLSYKRILLSCLILLITVCSVQAKSVNGDHKQLRHIVVVTFKPWTSNAQIQAVDKSFKNLSKLAMVKGFEWGIGLDDRNTQHVKHVYVTTFASKEDEASYGKSPEHQAHIKLGADYIDNVSATDYFVND